MGLRGVWNGSIAFGLVNIPVKLAKAQDPKEATFNQFCEVTEADENGEAKQVFHAVGRQEISKVTNLPIGRDDIVRGRKVGDTVVTVTDDELESLAPKATKVIEIDRFVDESEINPLTFNGSYYAIPAKGAERAYALLTEALFRTNKVGIAKWVVRAKEHLVAIRLVGHKLVVTQCYYGDEIRDASADIPHVVVDDEKLLNSAVALVESLSGEWNPYAYKDEQRERVEELVRAKAGGEAIKVEQPVQAEESTDLFAALTASLEAVK